MFRELGRGCSHLFCRENGEPFHAPYFYYKKTHVYIYICLLVNLLNELLKNVYIVFLLNKLAVPWTVIFTG